MVEPFSAAISAAAGTISAGASLAGTSMSGLMNNGYRVTCGIEIENWTKYPLLDPTATKNSGVIETPPRPVMPANREAMVARKASGCAKGTWGTVSWRIEGKNRRVVVLWSAPFNFDYYDNIAGVGITPVGVTQHHDWAKEMYYKNQIWFRRRNYKKGSSTLTYSDHDFDVHCNMGTTHQAVLSVQLIPKRIEDLAPPVKILCGY